MRYSAGPDQACYHDETSRINFRRDQRLYGKQWGLVATDLAEDFHSSHDGWEASWPLQIRIYEGEKEVARFSVEREYEPSFLAWEVDQSSLNEEKER